MRRSLHETTVSVNLGDLGTYEVCQEVPRKHGDSIQVSKGVMYNLDEILVTFLGRIRHGLQTCVLDERVNGILKITDN